MTCPKCGAPLHGTHCAKCGYEMKKSAPKGKPMLPPKLAKKGKSIQRGK